MGEQQTEKQALVFWKNRKYEKCLSILMALEKKDPENIRICHNVIISKYIKSNSVPTDEVIESINSLKENLSSIKSKKSKNLQNCENEYGEVLEKGIINLNLAILHYRRREICKSLSLAEPLFEKIGPLDEGAALSVCFLLLGLYIETGSLEQFKMVMSYLELFYSNLLKKEDKYTPFQFQDISKECLSIQEAAAVRSVDSISSHTDETLEVASETRNLCLPNISKIGLNLLNPSSAKTEVAQKNQKFSSTELKVLIHLYRAQMLLSISKLRPAEKEVSALLSASPSNLYGIYLQAQIAARKNKYHKALRLMSICLDSCNPESVLMKMCIYCSMGVMQSRLKQHNIAAFLFSNALQIKEQIQRKNSKSSSERLLPDASLLHEYSLRLIYNQGLQHFCLGCYSEALELFKKSTTLLYNYPILWLRMAECCIILYRNKRKEVNKSKQPIKRYVEISKDVPNMILLPGDAKGHTEAQNRDNTLQKDAYVYLQNAYSLLRQSEYYSRMQNAEKKILKSSAQDHIEAAANIKTGSEEDANLMKQAVLVNMAYITLECDQPEKTLSAISELRLMPDVDMSVITVASFYEAEALCLMDKPKKAEEVLKVALEMAGEKENDENQKVNSYFNGYFTSDIYKDDDLRISLFLNMAAVYAVNQEFQKARKFTQKSLNINPHSTQAQMINLYMELAEDNKAVALSIMKDAKLIEDV